MSSVPIRRLFPIDHRHAHDLSILTLARGPGWPRLPLGGEDGGGAHPLVDDIHEAMQRDPIRVRNEMHKMHKLGTTWPEDIESLNWRSWRS